MKKIVFIMIPALCMICAAAAFSRADDIPMTEARIFFVDSEINRLLPYTDELPCTDTQHMAEAAVEKLIKGRRDDHRIRQFLPDDRKLVSVRVRGDVAYVDLASKMRDDIPDSRDIERLIIFQIVDTLTSVKGIRFVKFTIDGNIHKSFMGYYDMRDTYKYTYPE